MERHTAGGKVHGEFSISYLVFRVSFCCLPVWLSTVQEIRQIREVWMGMGTRSTMSPSPPSFIITYLGLVGQSVSLQGLVGIFLPRKREEEKGDSRSPGYR